MALSDTALPSFATFASPCREKALHEVSVPPRAQHRRLMAPVGGRPAVPLRPEPVPSPCPEANGTSLTPPSLFSLSPEVEV